MTRPGHPGGGCTVGGCGRPVRARGLCATHHERWRRHGDPTVVLPPGGRQRPVAERFWSKVDYDGPVPVEAPELGPCWVWTAGRNRGWGAFNVPATGTQPRRHVMAHRYAYEQHVGPVPDGYDVAWRCHLADAAHCHGGTACPHRLCVNYTTHLLLLPVVAAPLRAHSHAARRAAVTHCPRGHRYDRIGPDGRQRCSRCVQEQAQHQTPPIIDRPEQTR
ncbi:MAG: hypothetical protein GEU83_03185 [Pseudonocardiaceae bacterium]|nr:hypothetical protein [Pseudonocardiaceae bacterium]